MGYSLARLLVELDCDGFPQWTEISFPAAFSYAVTRWNIDPRAGAHRVSYGHGPRTR